MVPELVVVIWRHRRWTDPHVFHQVLVRVINARIEHRDYEVFVPVVVAQASVALMSAPCLPPRCPELASAH